MKKIIAVLLFTLAAPVLANMCGLPPLPPLGCKLGTCICDANGNCQWVFVCK